MCFNSNPTIATLHYFETSELTSGSHPVGFWFVHVAWHLGMQSVYTMFLSAEHTLGISPGGLGTLQSQRPFSHTLEHIKYSCMEVCMLWFVRVLVSYGVMYVMACKYSRHFGL